jgi:hypothetical protein
MFHLDGKRIMKHQGNVKPANQTDDVVMTSGGYIG